MAEECPNCGLAVGVKVLYFPSLYGVAENKVLLYFLFWHSFAGEYFLQWKESNFYPAKIVLCYIKTLFFTKVCFLQAFPCYVVS